MTGESGGGDHHAVGMGWVGGCAGTEQIIWLNSDQVLYSHEMAQCIPRPAAILIHAADGVYIRGREGTNYVTQSYKNRGTLPEV